MSWERDIMSWERDNMSWERDNHVVGTRSYVVGTRSYLMGTRKLCCGNEILCRGNEINIFFHMSPQCCRTRAYVCRKNESTPPPPLGWVAATHGTYIYMH